MQYALLIYEKPTDFALREPDAAGNHIAAWRAYYKALVDAEIYAGGSPLDSPDTATTVRLGAGTPDIQDGPYASSKEQLGGFILLELPSLDDALGWAARCPAAAYGAVEVRPLAPDVHQRITK